MAQEVLLKLNEKNYMTFWTVAVFAPELPSNHNRCSRFRGSSSEYVADKWVDQAKQTQPRSQI
jgi:hypothetical protein